MVDIVTHAGIGLVLGAPFLATAPEVALGLIFGSVLPDLDAFSRVFGKRAFLTCHQTWSHSLPVIALISLVASLCAALVGWSWFQLGLGLAVGMTLHSLLDLTNTYGITLWLPLKRQRLCLEWLFFIDLGTIALTVGALLWIGLRMSQDGTVGWTPTTIWGVALIVWILLRAWLRRCALRLAPTGTVALIPSAWLPWRFYGTIEEAGSVRLITVNLRQQRLTDDVRVPVHDIEVQEALRSVPEIAIMRTLTPSYHVIAVTTTGADQLIRCRDLRLRNFTNRFGACDITRRDGVTTRIDFHA